MRRLTILLCLLASTLPLLAAPKAGKNAGDKGDKKEEPAHFRPRPCPAWRCVRSARPSLPGG